jgi:drug/metabolite transporter (DMT)-like permease
LSKKHTAGILAAFSSAIFLGMAPVFGKLAITLGFTPFAVVALRTGFAASIMFLAIAIFFRQYLYIFPVGLLGCALAGATNGLGSLLYYLALQRLDASVGQLLYSLYPFFVALWLILDHQPPTRLTLFRVALATIAVLLLTNTSDHAVDTTGVLMMIGASILYAMHLPINQRVLYEVPAPTVALYTLLAMSAVVIPTYLIFDRAWPAGKCSLGTHHRVDLRNRVFANRTLPWRKKNRRDANRPAWSCRVIDCDLLQQHSSGRKPDPKSMAWRTRARNKPDPCNVRKTNSASP